MDHVQDDVSQVADTTANVADVATTTESPVEHQTTVEAPAERRDFIASALEGYKTDKTAKSLSVNMDRLSNRAAEGAALDRDFGETC